MDTDSSPLPPAVLRPRDAARHVGLSLATLARMRTDGTGPQFVQLHGRNIAYTRASLDAFLASRPTFKSTAERTVAEVVAA